MFVCRTVMMIGQVETRNTPILMYHSISSVVSKRFKQFAVSPAMFAEHMSYVSQHNYTPITVTQFVTFRQSGRLERLNRPVVLTFDDGFADFYTDALPILKSHGFTATLYITTGYVGGTSRWLRREGETTRPMLTWTQLAEISAGGIECGAHSHSHPQLDVLPTALVQKEILWSKTILEDKLAQKILSFAYPFGYYTTEVRQMLQAAGYSSACAVKYAMSSPRDNPFALARLMITGDMDLDDFVALLTGHYSRITSAFKRARAKAWQVVRRGAARLQRCRPEGVRVG